MHNSGILERQYWANQKIKELRKHEWKIINKEAGKKQSNAAENPRRQRRRREKNIDNQPKQIRKNAALIVSAQN